MLAPGVKHAPPPARFAQNPPMDYRLAMKPTSRFVLSGLLLLSIAVSRLHADVVEMQNGDRYSGKVLSVSTDIVVLESEVLGKINVPRKKVATVMFGTNAAAARAAAGLAQVSASSNFPAAMPPAALAKTNANLSAALQTLGANTNFVGQVRQQMLGGSPEAASKYDEMVSGLMSGQMSVNDLRNQARSYADQLRELKRDLGPEAGDSIDAYLSVLDNFIKETADEATNAPPRATAPTR